MPFKFNPTTGKLDLVNPSPTETDPVFLAQGFISAGKAGGQTAIGGTGVTDILKLQGTSGNGTLTSPAIQFLTGDNGATVAGTILNNGNVGIGTTSPSGRLDVHGAGTTTGLTFQTADLNGVAKFTVLDNGVATLVSTPTGSGSQQIASQLYTQSRGQNLVTNGSGLMGNNYNFSTFTFDAVETHGGGGSMLNNLVSGVRLNDELIPVDISKTYRQIGWGMSGDTGGANFNAARRQYFGVSNLDIDGFSIGAENSSKFAGSTDTTLAAALNPGDTTVTLTNATGWYNLATGYSRHFCWYGYTNSKGYTYPNYTYTRNMSRTYSLSSIAYGIWSSPYSSALVSPVWASSDNSLTRTGSLFLTDGVMVGDTITSSNTANPGPFTVATVTATKLTFNEAVTDSTAATFVTYVGEGITGNVIKLRSPWAGPALAAGAVVRNNPDGATYKYISAALAAVPNAWTKYEGYIGPPDGTGIENTNQFRAGTSYIKMLFLINYAGAADNNVRWSDLWLSEMSANNLEVATATQIGVVTTGTQVFEGLKTFGTTASIGNYIKVLGSATDNTYDTFYGARKYPRITLVDTYTGGSTFYLWNLVNQMRFGTNVGNSADASWYTKAGIAANAVFNGQLELTKADGTAPLVVTSTTVNTNLNADMVDGKHSTDLLLVANGVGTGGTFTTVDGKTVTYSASGQITSVI